MSMRLRMGPVSISSRGRVGVKAGPVSFYGGGARRRRSRSNGGGGALAVLVAIVLVVAVVITYWYVVVPVLLVSAAVAVGVSNANKKRQAEQTAALEQEEAESQRRWLEAPPPQLLLPGRFTENWFASHVPSLHPGQVPDFLEELRERGWTDERIQKRVMPYLAVNPFYVERS